MNIYEVGKVVRVRRLAVGLTQQRLAKLAGLSRQTVQQLEAGTISDLSFGRLVNLLRVLGLNFSPPSIEARDTKRGLWMAAKNASVSYRGEFHSDQLQHALATGRVPANHKSYLLHFLDETPLQVVVMAVEETAHLEAVSPARIWAYVAQLASHLGSARSDLWL
ncbi:helix-turn-helix domain-containing protein [Janthinobacterium sp. PLB04]|uniref:Helix-turn-helix transcriptional regulator n=1 Tax=Janthinobacterium lividum TaxID=29581 RepID=A0AAJ4MU63_9BURK|nr:MULTISPECIES: helix-turn-helix transcriptional regulator [Janthinobacterium]KAB0331004.1 helix-turn-helix transcriptional regulator [Janthinobacterium lividum]QSX97216.1 helix-turn-helix transcriptional regulator [Janthinobacterium lividum]UGQ37140.1 helix-turn-helix domain-containing protein [Janthinobacterium sp. PLB04]